MITRMKALAMTAATVATAIGMAAPASAAVYYNGPVGPGGTVYVRTSVRPVTRVGVVTHPVYRNCVDGCSGTVTGPYGTTVSVSHQ